MATSRTINKISAHALTGYILWHQYLKEEEYGKYGIFDELLYDLMAYKKHDFDVLSGYNYNVISLGYECSPNIMAIASDLKPPFSQGSFICPFDTEVNPVEVAYDALDNDLKIMAQLA